jgi:HSP20 family molecular chaperone IbpA
MDIDNATIRVTVGSEPFAPGPNPTGPEAIAERRTGYTPPIDIHEGPDGLTLEADLPGANERNLRIELEENVLSLYARIDSSVPEGARLIHEEHRVGDFHRSFILSDEVDRDRITADLKNGALRLLLPKGERARARRIEIKA